MLRARLKALYQGITENIELTENTELVVFFINQIRQGPHRQLPQVIPYENPKYIYYTWGNQLTFKYVNNVCFQTMWHLSSKF